MAAYIIENDAGLLWSNSEGWTDSDDYDTFSETEHESLALPIGGRWVQVDWSIAKEQTSPVEG